ncbi:MAG: tRNA (adenosine(37)-N6)-threonylcarbamoyltransferase complex dimerization subunit type 1 TsaB [Hyphomicrobiaceae bacterium]
MLPCLAIDTCLSAVSAGLRWRDATGLEGRISHWEHCRGGHAERLLPIVETLLAAAGLHARDVRRIAVTLGPGTFTGVRTGIAVARAFALASNAEVVGASSLAVMAAKLVAAREDPIATTRIAVMVDARKGQVFTQVFAADGMATSEPELLTLADAAARLTGGVWQIGGSAATPVATAAGALGVQIVATHPSLEPDAANLLDMAARLAPLARVMPIYIRPPDALPQAGKSLPRATT